MQTSTHDVVQKSLLPRNFIDLLLGTLLLSVAILFASQATAQELTCDFNQNGKNIKIICLFGPSTEVGNFITPISSDLSVMAITNVSVDTVTINQQTFEKQIVLAELENIGFATLTVGTQIQTETFEIPAQNPLLAIEIPGVLPAGTLPGGDFVGLDEGGTFNVSIRAVKLEDGSGMNIGGFAALQLEGSLAFTFEEGSQSTLVHLGSGFGTVNLIVADNSLGETAKLLFGLEGVGPTLVTNFQLSLASASVGGNITGISDSGIPSVSFLEQNYPNPFNPTTKIKYSIPELSFVTLKVYDVLGNEIATLVNKEKQSGYYEVEFNSINLVSGIYFYKLQAGNFVEVKKMLLLR